MSDAIAVDRGLPATDRQRTPERRGGAAGAFRVTGFRSRLRPIGSRRPPDGFARRVPPDTVVTDSVRSSLVSRTDRQRPVRGSGTVPADTVSRGAGLREHREHRGVEQLDGFGLLPPTRPEACGSVRTDESPGTTAPAHRGGILQATATDAPSRSANPDRVRFRRRCRYARERSRRSHRSGTGWLPGSSSRAGISGSCSL